jgi:hypothetical protein
MSDHVDVAKSLTTLGIGEALVTVLDPKGIPTLVCTAQVLAPSSAMTAIDDAQFARVRTSSQLAQKYATPINRESAHEMLQKKLEQSAAAEPEPADDFGWKKEADDFDWKGTRRAPARRPRAAARRSTRQTPMEAAVNQMARTASREVTKSAVRGIAGILKNLF